MGSSGSKDDLGKVQMVGVTFLWKVEKYSTIASDKWLKSTTFTVSGQGYYLELSKNNCYLEVRLHRDGTSPDSSKLRCQIGLVDKKGHKQFTKVTETTVDKENDTVTLLKLEETGLTKQFAMVLSGDTLTICFKARILNDGEDSVIFRENTNVSFESLSADFGRCFESQFHSDVVLKAGDVSFSVHRVILSARSTVFAAMFKHDTSEKRKGIVNIADIQPHILEDILHYMYTGKIRELTTTLATLMYAAADKYSLLELKEECRKYIISSLATYNICDAAILANTYNETSIKDAVIQLVAEKRDEILNDDLWKTFLQENTYLASSILSAALISKK